MSDTNNFLSASFATIGMTLCDFYSNLAPWLVLGMVIVFVDLRFGVLAAQKRKETIRQSRMIRRTGNKIVDYLCWVTLAEMWSRTFGMTTGAQVVSMGVLFLIYGIEVNSCFNNYLEYKGINKRFDFYKLVRREDPLEDVDENNLPSGLNEKEDKDGEI